MDITEEDLSRFIYVLYSQNIYDNAMNYKSPSIYIAFGIIVAVLAILYIFLFSFTKTFMRHKLNEIRQDVSNTESSSDVGVVSIPLSVLN